jgi:hypothetical protein
MRQLLETLAFQNVCILLSVKPLKNKSIFSILFVLAFHSIGIANGNSKIHFLEDEISTSICLNCDNATDGGQIAGDETECPNPIFDPSLITNVTLPSGGSGNLEYIWIFTTDDPFGANSQWTPILNTNAPEYDPDPISLTTHYRRCTRREGCVEYVAESNIITKMVACCDPITNGGEIADDQSGCKPSFDPDALINISLPSGGSGNIEYQWYGSIAGPPFDPNSPNWFLIPGADGPNFDPGLLIQSTWFVRTSRRENCQDFNGISNIVQISLMDSPSLGAVISNKILCAGGNTGSINLMITGGVMPYQINWDHGIGNVEDPQNLAADIYNVTVSDASSCSSTLSMTVDEPDSLFIELNATPVSCGGMGDGSANVQITGGTPNYFIEWSNGINTDTINNLDPGFWSLTVTDQNGCSLIDSIEVAQFSDMVLGTESTNATCLGFSDGSATVNIISGGTPDFTYSWSDTNGQTTPTAVGLASGEYFVTVTDANACEAVDTVLIDDGTLITAYVSSNSVTCLGGNDGFVTIDSITGGAPDYSITWSLSGNDGNLSLTNLSAGFYTYIITDQNGCSATDSIEVQDGYEIIVSIETDDPTCLGLANGAAEITEVIGGLPDYSYQWNPMGQITSSISNLPSGNYSVIVQDLNGCIGQASGVVNLGASLDIITNAINETCLGLEDGAVEIIDVPNGTEPLNFVWSNGATTSSINSLVGGLYEIIVTDSLGCVGTESVTVESGGELNLDITKMDVQCGNDMTGSATVNTIGGTPDYTYLWNDVNSQTTQTAVNLGPGNYEVIVSDAIGCTSSTNTEILASNFIEMTAESGDVTCFGDSDGSVTVTVLNGNISDYTINWDTPQNQNSDIVENLPAGIYHVTLTDNLGCEGIDSVEVFEPQELNLTLTSNGPTCFGDSNGSANALATGGNGGYTYFWITTQTTPTITGLSNGVYFVTVTDQKGCATMEAIQLLSPDEIEIDFTIVNESCDGTGNGGITATVSGGVGGYTYDWEDVNLPDIDVVSNLTSGDYTLQVTDSNGCTNEATASVSSDANITLEVYGNDISCNGKSDGIAWVEVSGGSGNYTYNWNIAGGAQNDTIINLSAGTYSVIVSDPSGCSVSGSVTIGEPDALAVIVNSSSVLCEDDMDGTAIATASGGNAPYTYSWSNGGTSETLTNIGIGTYFLTVTDANNCQVTSSAIIEFTSDLSANSSSQNASCFGGTDGVASVQGIAGQLPYTYNWSTGETGGIVTGLSVGTYTVTILDNAGCSYIESVAVGHPSEIFCSASVTSLITTYGGNDGEATASAIGGTGDFTFEWETGDLTALTTNLSAGDYSVTATDENGCTCQTTVAVGNPSKLGNFVWQDENENGIQDFGEPGIEDIEVTLTGTTISGGVVNLSTFTDATGEYYFDGLIEGQYQLTFELKQNNVFAPKDEGSDNALDSDVDSDGKTSTIAISNGTLNLDWDAGMIELDEKINIGNFVWEDGNRDGIQDSTETGVPAVTVRLINATNGFVIASTSTNLFGFYQFNDVLPGEYQIEFIPSSLPTGYIFSEPNQSSDEQIDSDPDPINGKTEVFEVFPFTLDDFSWDAGIYEECDNVSSGGEIEGDEELCGIGSDPTVIGNVTLPSGGFGVLEYLWLQSNVPIYNGPGDPNWTIIPNSNSPFYDPGPISSDTYYIRCARRAGCSDYIGESNIVSKIIIEYPLTNIEEHPNQLCIDEGGKFMASIAGGGASYHWEFGNDATPSTASTRTVNEVSWSTAGFKPVILTVTRFGCSFSSSVIIEVVSCPNGNPLIVFGDFQAELFNNDILVSWTSENNDRTASYLIERAELGESFKTVGVIKGTEEESNSYEFLDENPLLGESQYRLKRIDSDYEPMYSSIVNIFSQPKGMNDIHFYPNPFSDRAILDVIEIQDEPVHVEVINTFAQVIDTFEIPAGASKKEMNFSHLPTGMYYIKVDQKGKFEYTFRVFKSDN